MTHPLLDCAWIDERTTVFTMGRTALIYLSDGTLTPKAFRGSRALFKVVAQACDPDRAQRYESLAAFDRSWRAARAAYTRYDA
jgi:serine/threonine-protein kinase